jgi:hypothetical protein
VKACFWIINVKLSDGDTPQCTDGNDQEIHVGKSIVKRSKTIFINIYKDCWKSSSTQFSVLPSMGLLLKTEGNIRNKGFLENT